MSALSERAIRGLGGRQLSPPSRSWLIPLLSAVAALALVLSLKTVDHHPLRQVILIGAGALVLFAVTGDALSVALVPAAWRPVRALLSVALGAAVSGMVLMAFGVAHVPLHVSLWLTLALGLLASWWVRRRQRAEGAVVSEVGRAPLAWAAVLGIVFLVALTPAWHTGDLTIYGENPDSSQVVGIAVLFQHVPPTATDISLPLDVVPPNWRFRYPIFYPLAAVSNLVHVDPIRAFPVLVALLVALAALGCGLVAVRCFGAPAWAGPAVSALLGFTWILQYVAWHPYWNQLWGMALMPFAVLFGWQALQRHDLRAGIACLVLALMLWFAYPLALPYPLAILAGVLVAYWQRPRRPTISGWRGWLAAVLVLVLLAPAVLGSVLKLKEAIVQLLTPGALWGGDVTQFVSFGNFAGTGGGALAAGAVLIAAAYGLWRLPPRVRAGFGVVLAVLLLLDLRFRLAASGPYMDFKHLCFMGLVVLSLAAAGLLARAAQPGRLRWLAVAMLVIWCGAALKLDHSDALTQTEQVTPQMFQIRQWAAQLPAGSSVRVDIPQPFGGMQLWAVYMLGDHPVDSYAPVLGTTYAHAAPGFRADYSLSLSIDPATGQPYPQPRFTENPPLDENSSFVLRRIDWPASADNVPQTASTRLVEP